MEGGQFRDSRMPRLAVAFVCATLAAMALAPVALAGSPAGDQYGQPLPGPGQGNGSADTGGGSSGSSSGSSAGGGSTLIPVAPSGSEGAGGANGSGDGSSSAGGSGGKAGDAKGGDAGSGSGADTQSSVVGENSNAHSVPQIAADSASDSWMPFFIAGLVALATAFAFLVFFRNRRRTAQH
jgi:hypothetical protein